MDYSTVFEQIKTGNDEKALQNMANTLMPECIKLIQTRSIYKDTYEASNVFYHAYLYVKSKIERGKCTFMGNESFKSYYKTACMHIAKEFMRTDESPNVVPIPEEWIYIAEDADEHFSQIQQQIYQRKLELYGVDLSKPDLPENILTSVVREFHNLNEKCKFLIILKYFINLSHFDIVESLYLFYEIKNEDVSKSELSRCIRTLRKRLGSQDIPILN